MFTFLQRLAKGSVRVRPVRPAFGIANLRKKLTCRLCGCPMLLKRFVPLHPSGIRGYYACDNGHDAAIDRDRVRRFTHESFDCLWFDV